MVKAKIEALESLREEILEWRENALRKLIGAAFLDKYGINGRVDAYQNVAEEIDKRVEDLLDSEREREVSS